MEGQGGGDREEGEGRLLAYGIYW